MTNISGGASTFIAVAKQSAKGTPNTTAAAFTFAKFLAGTDAQPAWEFLGPVREGGDGLDQRWDMRTAQKARATLVHHARPDITGQILSAFFGGGLQGNSASAFASTAGPIATHVFAFPAGGRTTYYTVVVGNPGGELTHVLYDARPVGVTVEGNAQQPVKITSEWVGIRYGASWGVAMAPAYETGDPFVFFGASVSFPTSGLQSTAISQYQFQARVDVDENLYTTDLLLLDIVDLARTVEVQAREVWINATNYMGVEYAGLVAPTYNLATGLLHAAHRVGSFVFSLEANMVRWSDSNITAIDPDNKTVYVDYAGVALAAGTHSLIARVMNAHASNYLG